MKLHIAVLPDTSHRNRRERMTELMSRLWMGPCQYV